MELKDLPLEWGMFMWKGGQVIEEWLDWTISLLLMTEIPIYGELNNR